jgi:hypothetical protein
MATRPIKEELQDLLRKLGFKPNAFYRIRFGGVVGKLALIASAALATIAVVAYKGSGPYIQWGCLAVIAVLGLRGIQAITSYADKHPNEATLEGLEVLALKQLENQFAAKGFPEIPNQAPVARTLTIDTAKHLTDEKNS